MRKSKTFVYIGIAFGLLILLGYMMGVRLSAQSISLEQDKAAHFEPSEVLSSTVIDGKAVVLTQHDSWIQCHVIGSTLGLLWKAEPTSVSPIDLSEPLLPQTESVLIETYQDACRWSTFKIDTVLILKEAMKLAEPYMGPEDLVLSHHIDRILVDANGVMQVDSSMAFTSGDRTIDAKYVVYFRNEPDWIGFNSQLRVNYVSVPQPVDIQSYYESRYPISILLSKAYLIEMSTKDEIIDLEHGKMDFTAVFVSRIPGWEYTYEEKVKAIYDLDEGWTYTLVDQGKKESIRVDGTWKVDLYEPMEGPVKDIYFASVHDLTVSGTAEFVSGDFELNEYVPTEVTMDFTFRGKHFHGFATMNVSSSGIRLMFPVDDDPDFPESLIFGLQIFSANEGAVQSVKSYVSYRYTWGWPELIP